MEYYILYYYTILSLQIPSNTDLLMKFDLYKPSSSICQLEIGSNEENNDCLISGNGKHEIHVTYNN